jgi:hypothetical protein
MMFMSVVSFGSICLIFFIAFKFFVISMTYALVFVLHNRYFISSCSSFYLCRVMLF